MTLFHFTLPVWFAERGGFERRRNIRYFTRYAQKVLDELGGELSYIITVNEPTVYASESYLRGSWPPNRTSKWQFWRVVAAPDHGASADLRHDAQPPLESFDGASSLLYLSRIR